jgi:hypothetical protein
MEIRAAVTKLLNFQIPQMDQVSFVGTPTAGFGKERTASPVGWVHGALLIGLKDWAQASNNDEWWKWLQVCLTCDGMPDECMQNRKPNSRE